MSEHRTKTIIVEDHDIMRQYLKTFVSQVNHCQIVAEAANGMEAIETIRNTEADLIVLDLSLPLVSGVNVLREAKKINPAKVLIVTLHTDKALIKKALDEGADGVCLKDRGAKVLERAVLETLEGKKPVYLEE